MKRIKKACAGLLLLTMSLSVAAPAFADSGNTDLTGINIGQSNFPDDAFRAYVSSEAVDTNQSGMLSDVEIKAVTTLNLDAKGIKSLKGIEHFTKLTELNCANNQLTELNLNKNTALERLNCNNNQISTLDLSANKALVALNVSANTLTALDTTANTALKELSCDNNSYSIALTKDGTFDLKSLPGKFNASKAFGWEGASVEGNLLTALEGAKTMTYSYDCGNGRVALFELKVKDGEIAPSGVFTITFDANGGSVSPASATTTDGKLVGLPTPSRSGYTFDGWRNDTGQIVTADTTFSADTTLVAQWKKQTEPFSQFKDVVPSDWFYNDVQYAYENKIMSGTAVDTFSPYVATTRGMIMSILYRMEGSPNMSEDNLGYPFADVDASMYYAIPIYWARHNGIASGFSKDSFGPENAITREQLAVFLYNYANFKKIDTTKSDDLAAFGDASAVSPWADKAVRWAVGNSLISGKGNGILDPQGTATRAEVAAILHRFSRSMD